MRDRRSLMDTLLAIDWGSSSLRACAARRRRPRARRARIARGILTVPPAASPPCSSEASATGWTSPATRCLMAGMVGSRQGWVEAPYCPCPAGLRRDRRARCAWMRARRPRIAIVPGLTCERDGVPDVMRGEEMQGPRRARPARHARRDARAARHAQQVGARVAGGRIARFSTLMTRRVLCAAAPAFDPRAHACRRTTARSTKPRSMRGVGTRARRPAACCRPRSACARWRCSSACRPRRCRATCRGS